MRVPAEGLPGQIERNCTEPRCTPDFGAPGSVRVDVSLGEPAPPPPESAREIRYKVGGC